MLSQLGNISRGSSGMTSKSVACVLVSHSKWKTSLSTEATNAALTPAAVSKSISKTERTTNARRYSVWTRNIAGTMYADTDHCTIISLLDIIHRPVFI
jgi:hypothetical protein